MNKHLLVLTCILFGFLCTNRAIAQYEDKGWLIGGGFNFIDDSGTAGSEPLNFSENWSSVAFPSRFSMGYLLRNGMFFQGFASYNRYNKDVIVDGVAQQNQWNYYALDGLVGYGFKTLIDPRGWFDPYVQTGMGLNRLAGSNEFTLNLGGGFNFWVNERFAINLNTLGKWALGDTRGDNHIQHGIGVIIKPDLKKMFAGKEDSQSADESADVEVVETSQLLASVEEMPTAETNASPENKEEIKPMAVANQAENSTAQQNAEIIDRRLKRDLAGIPGVSFEVNSSFLKESDIPLLNQLLAYMQYYPTTVIEIRGNVDARGTEEYNAWLSVRRSGRIKEYLTKMGIAPERIHAVGSIKNKTDSPCKEDSPCSEAELTESRRVEYVLLEY